MSDNLAADRQDAPMEPGKMPPESKPALSQREKLRRFLIGFVGWWVVNIPLSLLLARTSAGGVLFIVTFAAQVIVLIAMAFGNRWIALGIVAAIALNLIISLILGLFLNAVCWIPFTLGNW